MYANKTLYQQHTDEELARATGKGSTEAFNELYERYGQKMFGYFFRMLWKDEAMAEDATQELFLKLIRNAQRFEAGRTFSTWFYSIAHNMCKNEYRKKTVRMKHSDILVEGSVSTTEKNADLQRFKKVLHDVVNNLPEEKKVLYVLRFEEQLSVPVIGDILQLPEGTVKSRIFHLMKELKSVLQPFKGLQVYP